MGLFIRKETDRRDLQIIYLVGDVSFKMYHRVAFAVFHGRGGNRRLKKKKRHTTTTLLLWLKYNCLVKLNRTILVSMPIIMPPRVALLLWLTYAFVQYVFGTHNIFLWWEKCLQPLCTKNLMGFDLFGGVYV